MSLVNNQADIFTKEMLYQVHTLAVCVIILIILNVPKNQCFKNFHVQTDQM